MDKVLRKDKDAISSMFNSIAGKYDFLNHFLSLGIDKGWRNKLVKFVKSKKSVKVLDLACGTGDLTIALHRAGIEVVGMDIAEKMLEVAKVKNSKLDSSNIPAPEYLLASADLIPMPDNSFDAVTIAFGIRNFENRKKSLHEIRRVLSNEGYLCILEFASPKNLLWRGVFNLYFLNLLPLIGRLVSKDANAYSYLPDSVRSFPQYEEFCKELLEIGYSDIKFRSLTGGVAVLYTAKKANI